ncbi:TetR/AcrR family transcriptional regulator [Streptomyces sp. NPDC060366]|uniref:TetR/AcrR family transcriptional regulator n=1 Tax=Streptomyces sp. NPDC060366 TaxID=3347105 RepID=UPI00365D2EBC
MTGKTGRGERADATRELILVTAERLFAEHGVFAVSNRQVSEAAGQGNNAAVGYHFGTKTDLVRAIVRKHALPVEQLRLRMVAEAGDSSDVRDWVACLVRPITDHLAELGSPTWYARFAAQVMTDPGLREIVVTDSLDASSLHRIIQGLDECLPDLPAEVRAERGDMARQLMVHMCAERERALALGSVVRILPGSRSLARSERQALGAATPRSSWRDAGTGLIDAIVGLWLAPVTRP